MTDEPYRPGGEHCPKCGYRHDGRCEEARCQCGHTIFEHYDNFCGGCQCREFRHDGRPNEREQFIKRCEDFIIEKGFGMGPVAGWDARQPEIDALRESLEASRVAYKALAVETYDRHMARNGNWSWEDREDWPAITMAMAVGREARRKPVD